MTRARSTSTRSEAQAGSFCLGNLQRGEGKNAQSTAAVDRGVR